MDRKDPTRGLQLHSCPIQPIFFLFFAPFSCHKRAKPLIKWLGMAASETSSLFCKSFIASPSFVRGVSIPFLRWASALRLQCSAQCHKRCTTWKKTFLSRLPGILDGAYTRSPPGPGSNQVHETKLVILASSHQSLIGPTNLIHPLVSPAVHVLLYRLLFLVLAFAINFCNHFTWSMMMTEYIYSK